MKEFKVGDKLKRIDSSWGGMQPGDTGTVTAVHLLAVEFKEYSGTHARGNLKLVNRLEEPTVTASVYPIKLQHKIDPTYTCNATEDLQFADVGRGGTHHFTLERDMWDIVEAPLPIVDTDVVNSPKHYMVIGNTEACDLIKVMLEQYAKDFPEATPYQIYCAGNAFKYRLRAGEKDNIEQEIAKASKYKDMHNDN